MQSLQWELFEDDERYASSNLDGMEAALDDGTMLDVLRYRDSEEWCWMIRSWDEDAQSYSIIASYDTGYWFSSVEEAFDELVAYIDYVEPNILSHIDLKRSKANLLQKAAAVGFAAMIALATVALPSFLAPEQAYAGVGTHILVYNMGKADGAAEERASDTARISYVESYYDLAHGSVYEATGAQLDRADELLGSGDYEMVSIVAQASPDDYGIVRCDTEWGTSFDVEDEDFYTYIYYVQNSQGVDAVGMKQIAVDRATFEEIRSGVDQGELAGSLGQTIGVIILCALVGLPGPILFVISEVQDWDAPIREARRRGIDTSFRVGPFVFE